jgi:environmental stress-induced protein Ves
MTARLLRSSDYSLQSWKNGGGTTSEIWRQDLATGEFCWRLSMANVKSDGPFSLFPGIDRQIMLVEGNGMILEHKDVGAFRLERPFVPHAFSGDVETSCRLIGGPCRDLNLMVGRSEASGRLTVERLAAGEVKSTWPAGIVALVLLAGSVEMGNAVAASGDTLLLDVGTPLSMKAARDAAFAIVQVERHTTQ